MTLGQQIRLWFRQASTQERQVTVGACCALAVMALVSVLVAPTNGGVQITSGPTPNGGPAASSTSAPEIGAGGATETTSGSSEPPATVRPAATRPPSSDSGASVATSEPTVPSTSTSTSTPPPSTAPSVPLVASDRGISEDTVKIGFLPAQVGGLDGAGFALNVRDDAAEYAVALGDYVNAHGGVIGRKVEVVTRKTDPIDQSDQAAACQSMASDHKVFGVIDVGSIADTPYMDCIAVQNQLPYIHNTIWGTDWLARSQGLEVGYPAAIDRVSQTWVRDLQAMGWLPEGGVVGVVGDRCAATDALIDNVLVPLIKAAGVAEVVVAKHDCDAESVVTQPGSFPVRFRAKGVTHVFVAANFVSNTVFMAAAAAQGYTPEYTASDWWQAASDSSAANYPAGQYDGAVAITSNGLLLPRSGHPARPGAERCNEVATSAGLPPLQFAASDQELYAFCDNFFLMIDGLAAAGPNPTRWDWATAIQGLGEHPSVIYGPSHFAPGKVTGSDTVFTARWSTACTCYRVVSDSRPAVGS